MGIDPKQVQALLEGKRWKVEQMHLTEEGASSYWKVLFEELSGALVLDFFRANTFIEIGDRRAEDGTLMIRAVSYDQVEWTYRLTLLDG